MQMKESRSRYAHQGRTTQLVEQIIDYISWFIHKMSSTYNLYLLWLQQKTHRSFWDNERSYHISQSNQLPLLSPCTSFLLLSTRRHTFPFLFPSHLPYFSRDCSKWCVRNDKKICVAWCLCLDYFPQVFASSKRTVKKREEIKRLEKTFGDPHIRTKRGTCV